MADARIVLITGATGKQGGAVARHLAGKGFTIRAMTRKPGSDAARALTAAGATVVAGDLDDPASLETALTGAWGVFAVQNTWEAGVQGEEAQGSPLSRGKSGSSTSCTRRSGRLTGGRASHTSTTSRASRKPYAVWASRPG